MFHSIQPICRSQFVFVMIIILCLTIVFFGQGEADPIPTCQAVIKLLDVSFHVFNLFNLFQNDFKYDFTDCDAYEGRWRVSVPITPGKCRGGLPDPPIRVDKCCMLCYLLTF